MCFLGGPVTLPQHMGTKWKPPCVWLLLSCESLHSTQHRAHFSADTACCHHWIALTFSKSFPTGNSGLYLHVFVWKKTARLCQFWTNQGGEIFKCSHYGSLAVTHLGLHGSCGLNWTISTDLLKILLGMDILLTYWAARDCREC